VTPALELLDIVKRFGNVLALNRASLRVQPGSVHAVLGENGAGKTTLMRVAYGLTQPDAGTVRRDGQPYTARHPADAIALGIGMVQQHFSLVPAMSVAENVVLGLRGSYRPADADRHVAALSRETGLNVDPTARVEHLPISAQQRVEILKALIRRARVLILDEPTAVLAPQEIDELMQWLRRFVSQGSNAGILITHKLREATSVADDVTVLREGSTVLTGPATQMEERQLIRAMIGGAVDVAGSPATRGPGATIAVLDHVSLQAARGHTALHDVTIEIHAGELVGVAGVEGAGQHALLRLLAGRLAPTQGTIQLPADIGFIPEDRHREAVILSMSLTENLALRDLARRRGRMPWASISRSARNLIMAFDVRASGPAVPMAALSGGNQQRFVVGRAMEPLPSLLVAENPTRGLDVRATARVHEGLRAARDAGAAVILYSSDVDEVLELASRVVVMHTGRLHDVPATREDVGRAMVGATIA
jgi:simple sugar transport system ATP-binding protein